MDIVPEKDDYNWGMDATLDVIGGKWKPLIIYELNDETLRFSQLLDRVQPRITQRMLTKQLRQLEEDGLITRKVYAQVPPKVEYSLTETGKSLIPILNQLCEWDTSTWETALSTNVKNKWHIFIKSFISLKIENFRHLKNRRSTGNIKKSLDRCGQFLRGARCKLSPGGLEKDESMNEEIRRGVLQKCESMEIPLVGIANVERWHNPPFLAMDAPRVLSSIDLS